MTHSSIMVVSGILLSLTINAEHHNIFSLVTPAGKGLTSWLLLVMFIVFLLLSNVVSWVMCGT